MLEQIDNAGPCATACKPGAGTGKRSTVFESIIVADREHLPCEAGLPGRADRVRLCRSCGCETASGDGICAACADAMREERAEALVERCRIHRVRRVEDLPVSVLQEMHAERGRC
jgi:recombinational DNA repair protein RecR